MNLLKIETMLAIEVETQEALIKVVTALIMNGITSYSIEEEKEAIGTSEGSRIVSASVVTTKYIVVFHTSNMNLFHALNELNLIPQK